MTTQKAVKEETECKSGNC